MSKFHLSVDECVGKLFMGFVQPEDGMQIYSNRLDHCEAVIRRAIDMSCRATVVGTDNLSAYYKGRVVAAYGENQISFTHTNTPEWLNPRDQFHLAFAVFPFEFKWLKEGATDDQLKPDETNDPRQQVNFLEVEDRMMHWRVSQGKEKRMAPLHLVGLEGLMRATQVGGYFGAVLPKKWIGRDMPYMKWWNDRAALVARIALPESAVVTTREITKIRKDYDSAGLAARWPETLPDQNISRENFTRETPYQTEIELAAPGEWELLVWHRPVMMEGGYTDAAANASAEKLMPHAKFRFSPFIYKLPTSLLSDVSRCVNTFHAHEWFKQSVRLWKKAVKDNFTSSWCGTYLREPRGVPSVEDMFFFEPNEEHSYRIRIIEADKIKTVKYGVQLKIGSKVRLSVPDNKSKWAATTASMLLEMRQASGWQVVAKPSPGKLTWEWQLDERFRRSNFAEIREEVVQKLEDWGLVPCMTPNDYHAFQERTKWLSRQLCPIERMVPIQKERDSDQMTSEEKSWELAYEDTGMLATYPEEMNEWKRRAQAIMLDAGHDRFNKWYDDVVKATGSPPPPDEIFRNRPDFTFPYQFGDIIYIAAKDGELQGNVMGLGKTRIGLFAAILRGVKKVLICCPARLVDVWRDEIINTIVPYMRRVKKNWNGDRLDASINVIEWAKDCRPENLRFFNIISYDKLKATPRDVIFYRCPKCGVIACKRSRDDAPLPCPGNPNQPEAERCSHVIKMWRQSCAGDDLNKPKRKYYIQVDRQTKKDILNEDGTPKVIPWGQVKNFTRESWRVVDPRPPRPTVQLMDKLDTICKKVSILPCGVERDKETGEEKTIYKPFDRNPHVAWTFSDLLRWSFPMILADEALHFMNAESQRAQALFHLCARTKVSMTGTPIKGYPQKILAIANWTFKRQVLPDYRDYDPNGEKRFLDKYRTDVLVVREGKGIITSDGDIIGGTKKQVPKINNPELFQAEMAPLLRRHVRTEPDIVRAIPRKKIVTQNIKVPMDPLHRAYYQRWQQMFAEWWQKMKSEEEKKRTPPGALLTKLTYLINASTIPHKMLDGILKGKDDQAKEWAALIGQYKGPVTAKMKKSWEIIEQAIKQGDKTISFSWRTANQDIGALWAKRKKFHAMAVDGRVPLAVKKGQVRSERHEMVEAFRQQNYNVLFAGLEALSEGFNIPEANHGIILDCGWDPTGPRQALGRMNRPQQAKPIYQYYLMHEGTIDDYMIALCYLKGRSSDEGIDYMDFDDFSTQIIPDIHQYAEAIVDGTEEVLKANMWLAIEHNRAAAEEEGEE